MSFSLSKLSFLNEGAYFYKPHKFQTISIVDSLNRLWYGSEVANDRLQI